MGLRHKPCQAADKIIPIGFVSKYLLVFNSPNSDVMQHTGGV